MRIPSLTLLVLLAGCAALPMTPAERAGLSWREAATADDRERLRKWRSAFAAAIAAARSAGHAQEIAREGALLDPDAAIAGEPIPNGDYRCRVIKLGAKSPGLLNYVSYPYFRCRIEQRSESQAFAKLSGSQRYVGRIYPGDALRQVFLGTLVLGDERQALRYGIDRERDIAGHVEQIGPGRWRIVMPRPHFESQLDVLELVPAGG